MRVSFTPRFFLAPSVSRSRPGSKLNQMRFLRRSGRQDRYWRPALKDAELRKLDKESPLVDGVSGQAAIRDGLNVGVDLRGAGRARPSSAIGL